MNFHCSSSVLLVAILLTLFPFLPKSANIDGNLRKSPSHLIAQLISSFPQCKLFLMYGNFDKSNDKLHHFWSDQYMSIISRKEIISTSAGVTNMDMSKNQGLMSSNQTKNPFLPIFTLRPYRSIEASQNCHIVILVLPVCLPQYSGAEAILHSRLNVPLTNPTTVRNQDKFIIVSNASCFRTLYQVKVVAKLKYKLFIPIAASARHRDQAFTMYQYCAHCFIKEKVFSEVTNDPVHLFPDFQRNYFGSMLKVSATDKLPGLLEIETDPISGINFPKRGVYALALLHLARGLNFTWKLYRSSGGGSTGHPLSNGTWLGTVGDVYNEQVDFGLVCGMTFIRHPVVELCFTITFEYISFAVGPRARVYTWKAIFWPFKPFLWTGMIASTILVIAVSYFLMRFSPEVETSSWGILSMTQYYPRVWVEQADELPNLPQSVQIIVGWWLLFALIGSTLYRAKMVTFMTFPILSSSPENFDELAKSKYQIQFHYFGNVAYNTFKTSTSPTYMTIFQKMSREPNPLKCLKSTLSRKPTSCILFGCAYEELKNRNLSDRFGQSPIRMSPNYGFMYTPGVMHEKNADFSPNFKWILQNSMQMGLNQQWEKSDMNNLLKLRNAWLKSLRNPEERRNYTFRYDVDASDVLRLVNLTGAFSILFVGIVFAVILFAGEKAEKFWKCCSKNNNIEKIV